MRYSKLIHHRHRRIFDPSSKQDLLELKHFIENKHWKNGCPFFVEYPWEDIPAMCKDKYASHMLAHLK
jgi:hypothetical protein